MKERTKTETRVPQLKNISLVAGVGNGYDEQAGAPEPDLCNKWATRSPLPELVR